MIVRSISAYLPASLYRRLRKTCADGEGTYADVMLDAVHAVGHERLGGIVASAARPSGRPRHNEQQVQVTVRFREYHVEMLDELAARVGAANRSALLAAALQGYFREPAPVDGEVDAARIMAALATVYGDNPDLLPGLVAKADANGMTLGELLRGPLRSASGIDVVTALEADYAPTASG